MQLCSHNGNSDLLNVFKNTLLMSKKLCNKIIMLKITDNIFLSLIRSQIINNLKN